MKLFRFIFMIAIPAFGYLDLPVDSLENMLGAPISSQNITTYVTDNGNLDVICDHEGVIYFALHVTNADFTFESALNVMVLYDTEWMLIRKTEYTYLYTNGSIQVFISLDPKDKILSMKRL